MSRILSGIVFAFASAWAAAPPKVEMRNVHYHYDQALILEIRRLTGTLQPMKTGVPPTFDDKNSFRIDIESAEVALTESALAQLLNAYVFAYPGSPVRNLTITIAGGRMKQKGVVHKGVDLPFEMVGSVEAAPDGRLKIHADSVKAAHIPVKSVLGAFGVKLDDLIDASKARGVKVVNNDLFLNPPEMLPAPGIRGRITKVWIEGERLVQQFGAAARPPEGKGNYMWYRGGVIRFGKLTMHDADLQLIDMDPGDPFHFSLERYRDQLVAGYSKTTPTFGLETYMRDVTRLPKPHRAK